MSAYSDSGGETVQYNNEPQQSKLCRSRRAPPSASCVRTSQNAGDVDYFATEHDQTWPCSSNRHQARDLVNEPRKLQPWLKVDVQGAAQWATIRGMSRSSAKPQQISLDSVDDLLAPRRRFKLRQKSASEANTMKTRQSSDGAGLGSLFSLVDTESQVGTGVRSRKMRYVSCASHSLDKCLVAPSMEEKTRLTAKVASSLRISTESDLPKNPRSSARRLHTSSRSFSQEHQASMHSRHPNMLLHWSPPQESSLRTSSNRSTLVSETIGFDGNLSQSRKQDVTASQAETLPTWKHSPLPKEHPAVLECLEQTKTLSIRNSETQSLINRLLQAEMRTEYLWLSPHSDLPIPKHGCFGANTKRPERVTMPSSSTHRKLPLSLEQSHHVSRTRLQDSMMPRLSLSLRQRTSRQGPKARIKQDLSGPNMEESQVLHESPSLTFARLPQQQSTDLGSDCVQCNTGNALWIASERQERQSTPSRRSASGETSTPRIKVATVPMPSSSLCQGSSIPQRPIHWSCPSGQASNSTLSLHNATDHAARHPLSTAAGACREHHPIAHMFQPDRLGQEHLLIMPKTSNGTATALVPSIARSDRSDGPQYGKTFPLTGPADICYFHCTMRSERKLSHSWRGVRQSRLSPDPNLTSLSAVQDHRCGTDHSRGKSAEEVTPGHINHRLCRRFHRHLLQMEADSQRSTTESTAANTTSFRASQNTLTPDRTLQSLKPDLKWATICQSREKEGMGTGKSIQGSTSGGPELDERPLVPSNACNTPCEEGPSRLNPELAYSSLVCWHTRTQDSDDEVDSDVDGSETPITSPENSPIKLARPPMRRLPSLSLAQFDGGHDCIDSEAASNENELAEEDDDADMDLLPDDETPLIPASPAKGAHAFRHRLKGISALLLSTPQRQPSALLRHCERNATSRQRKLMAGGIQSPDRFIPTRAEIPAKGTLSINQRSGKLPGADAYGQLAATNSDPFAPATRRSLRMNERYATLRGPAPAARPVGRTSTLVSDARRSHYRVVSEGAIWTVGSTLVTKGVPSTPTGRGGRVTSGTSAPHYSADFLRKVSPHDEEECHGNRLAVAMGMDQHARLLDYSSPISTPSAPSSPNSSQAATGGRIWRDGKWDQDSPVSPTAGRTKKVKDVPVIPFRVLDAPALRDDYYCSLLAYSPTLDCLAVGLGPHVYLWSEDRQRYTPKLPDSLTAPFSAHITSLSFSSAAGGSAVLAIGRADGRITLWSPLDRDPRFDSEQPSAVSFVCFRPNTVRSQSIRESCATVTTEELLVGDEAGNVYLYSVEWPDQDQRDLFDWHGSMTLLARISCHSQQVCGIAWSRDGEFFATGGNDNQLFLFETKKIIKQHRRRQEVQGSEDTVKVRSGDQDNLDSVAGQGAVLNIVPGQQKHIFTLNAAVRALAFAPWQPSLLAAGGGSNDRCIHFFHTVSGARLATIDCHAQVTSLIWSEKKKEIAATFGFAQPEHKIRVAVFSWPSCRCVVKIPWVAEERALHSVAYPRGPAGGLPGKRATDGSEGGPWYGKRTREEGCLVVATSDASIKFHELWAERDGTESRSPVKGVLSGSQILEGNCSSEVEDWCAIR